MIFRFTYILSFLKCRNFLFRSSLRQSRPNKAGLKCPSVRAYVRTSTKRFFDFSEIWHVGTVEVDE